MTVRIRPRLRFLILLLALGALWYFGRAFSPDAQSLLDPLEKIPLFWRGAAYIVLYVAVTFFLFFSKDVFWFAGAVLFGAALSTFFICIAEALNAVILFHLARSLGRAYTQNVLKERYRSLDEHIGKVHFLWLFLFRAVPLIPYRFMDLAAGLTRISFGRYFAAVLLGSWLKTYWIQFILTGVGQKILDDPKSVDAFILLDYFLKNEHILWLSLIYVVLVVVVFLKIKRNSS